MNCPNPTALQALVEKTLPAEQQPGVRSHLETCTHCREVFEQLVARDPNGHPTAEQRTPPALCLETALFDTAGKLPEAPTHSEPTQAERNAAPPEVDLSFLQPPQRPGALGRLDEFEVLSVVGRGGFGI